MDLNAWGWDGYWASVLAEEERTDKGAGRVTRVDRGRWLVHTESGEALAALSGKLQNTMEAGESAPAVGDWVLGRWPDDGTGVIEHVLPRRSALSRKVPGSRTQEQVIAANVDTAFVVCGLDGDFNLRRIERFLTLVWESGAMPVVLLNKADCVEDREEAVRSVEAVSPGVPVECLSALEDESMEAVEQHLAFGKTCLLLGSSGVGKSTLLNRLSGSERMETGGVREDDSRGRHTTTHRELVRLPGGALLIDTPGLREIQLWTDGDAVAETFTDIEALADDCRFRDCTHAGEPGCAVEAAVAQGTLDAARLESFHKLSREVAYLERRQDAVANSNAKSRWKQINKEQRRLKKAEGRGK